MSLGPRRTRTHRAIGAARTARAAGYPVDPRCCDTTARLVPARSPPGRHGLLRRPLLPLVLPPRTRIRAPAHAAIAQLGHPPPSPPNISLRACTSPSGAAAARPAAPGASVSSFQRACEPCANHRRRHPTLGRRYTTIWEHRGSYPGAMSAQYVYTMHRLSKSYPPDKTVLKDLTLAFLPGAKIGVLGYNGAGKSTVLRIMAGQETDFRGDAMLAPNATVGMLEQEPQLDEAKDVKGNVEDGVRETKALLEPLQRARRELLRGDGRRVRAPAGPDRRRRRLEPRHAARVRDGRPAPAARRRRRLEAVRR